MSRPSSFLRLSFVCAITLLFALGCRKQQETSVPSSELPKVVSISEVPKDIQATFYKACPQSKILRIRLELGGQIAMHAQYWVFRCEQDGKLRDMAIGSPDDIHFHDVTP
jgi:hypothetical protein